MTDAYEIHQVEREDLNEGWIWVRNEQLRDKIENRRPVLRVRDTGSGPKVYCETLYADETYLSSRRHPISKSDANNLVFLSAWYRRHLGIEGPIGSSRSLEIKGTNRFLTIWWQLRACSRHPQVAVVMSTVLAVVGTGLGIVGVAAVLKDAEWAGYVWQAMALSGVVVILLGVVPLLRARN